MKYIKILKHILNFSFLVLLLASCLPEQQVRTTDPTVNSGQTSNNNTDVVQETETLTLPETTNFLQLGTTKSTTTLNLFSDYTDTFLIRGNKVITFLKNKTQTSQSNFCLITNYPGSSGIGSKNILVTSARIRSYYNNVIKGKEYFLQVEPNNETVNQGDCLTVSLAAKLQTTFGTSNFAFKLSDICPSCNTNLPSTSLRLFNTSGVEETTADISFLFLNIVPSVGTSNEASPICTINANCTSIGFNCCLAGQCVNHGEVRSEVDKNSDKYKIAQQIVSGRPELITNYEDVFYACPLMVPTDSDNNQGENIDPVQQASDLFTELQNLYNCTTPQVDEFSICVNDYPNASDLMSSSPYLFSANNDDLTFSTFTPTGALNNIVQINYAGETLFKEKLLSTDTSVALDSSATLTTKNDSLTTPQRVSIQKSVPVNALNDVMSIYFKVDGTCEKLGSSLARCHKYYTQGQRSTPGRSSDHTSGSQSFTLPPYADTSFNVIVNIGESPVPEGTDTWSISGNTVVFNSSEFPIFDNQKMVITYFVSNNVAALTGSKEAAQSKIDSHCKCDPNKDACTLTPVKTLVAGIEKTTSFICTYPDPDVPTPPLQTTVFLNSKTVPHKFYDVNGVNYDLGDSASEDPQEGVKFEYTDGHNLKPNNVDKHIGFNEIYGSMNIDAASPQPPKVVNLDKGKTYDIFIDQGSFSTCLNCGSDYFSGMQKIFPNNFQYNGGGYLPDLVESRRRSNKGDYSADDFRFGRACFVPATMIPWTHRANSNLTTQRNDRQNAQHFLFANGYNKDWYGFDYGSVIGSFDGIKWFAIGNQRKIRAESKKLYLAVNAYFGDLTINNSFKVTVNEMNAVLNSGSLVRHDSDSDGAQCQKAHYCENDNDCITQVGYDYSCQNVSSFQTPWPQFDASGNEVSGSNPTSLLGLVGGSNGQVKRCVYRGQGSLCAQRNMNVNAVNSYTNSTLPALHTCSQNSYCADINQSEFNTKIARYAESPGSQNIQTFISDKTDTFGLGARILGRPFNYFGNEGVTSNLRVHFNALNVDGLCVPGKDIDNVNTLEEMNFINTTTRQADKITNIGRTIASTTLQNENFLAACPATDDDGDFTHFKNLSLNSTDHKRFAIKNNMSTNSLILPSLSGQNLFNDNSAQVQRLGYHKNSCLRAPGAKCFSDFECSPNSYISGKFKAISNFNGEINTAEQNFWEEELVCANSQERYQENSIYPNPVYETNEHKCCRETSKDFTYFSQPHENSTFKVVDNTGKPLIPGVNQDYNDPERYSRTHTVYDKLISDPTNYPSMVSAAPQPSSPLAMTLAKIKQYNTLHLNNERMCCTGHWTRKFASGTNGNNGGTKHTNTTLQNIPIVTFKSLSWNPNNVPALNAFPSSFTSQVDPFTCTTANYVTSDCEVQNINEGSNVEKKYLEWFSKFELIGIPQVLIETNNEVEKPLSTEAMDIDNDGTDDYEAQQDISALKLPIENTIKNVNVDGVIDATYDSKEYYSAASYDNFEIGGGKLKKVFSESEFKCCIPTGIEIGATTPESSCCTGSINGVSGPRRCCLPDFTDLSVYTNRYVSSEGAFFNGQKVSDSDIDPTSGYIKKEVVVKMAGNMCCSGKATFGSAINQYLIPIDFENKFANAKTRRWLYLENLDDDVDVGGGVSKYNIGLKWNNHVYCVPADFEDDSGSSGGSGGGGAVSN
jgi:hypothetical protein